MGERIKAVKEKIKGGAKKIQKLTKSTARRGHDLALARIKKLEFQNPLSVPGFDEFQREVYPTTVEVREQFHKTFGNELESLVQKFGGVPSFKDSHNLERITQSAVLVFTTLSNVQIAYQTLIDAMEDIKTLRKIRDWINDLSASLKDNPDVLAKKIIEQARIIAPEMENWYGRMWEKLFQKIGFAMFGTTARKRHKGFGTLYQNPTCQAVLSGLKIIGEAVQTGYFDNAVVIRNAIRDAESAIPPAEKSLHQAHADYLKAIAQLAEKKEQQAQSRLQIRQVQAEPDTRQLPEPDTIAITRHEINELKELITQLETEVIGRGEQTLSLDDIADLEGDNIIPLNIFLRECALFIMRSLVFFALYVRLMKTEVTDRFLQSGQRLAVQFAQENLDQATAEKSRIINTILTKESLEGSRQDHTAPLNAAPAQTVSTTAAIPAAQQSP